MLAEQRQIDRINARTREWEAATAAGDTATARRLEAGIAMGWSKYVGPKGTSVSIEHFGASAAGGKLFEEFGFSADHVVDAAKSVLS